MPATPISRATAEHYLWGGPNNDISDGWYLVRTPALNIIEERLPPAAFETRHYHKLARQFAYVLAGELTIEIEHHFYVLKPGEGVEISPGQAHQVFNRGAADLSILLTSQPPSHGDRYEAPLLP